MSAYQWYFVRCQSGREDSICKQLIDAMQGEIHVVSQPGKGSSFIFTIPLPQTQEFPSAETAWSRKRRKILVASSSQSVRELAEHCFDGKQRGLACQGDIYGSQENKADEDHQ